MKLRKISACLTAGLLFSSIAVATEAETEEPVQTKEKTSVSNELAQAFKDGKPNLGFRLRHENSKQDYLEDGMATTLRTTVGYESAEFNKSLIKIEFVDVANFFGQRFNAGVSDLNNPAYTLIRDPRGAGITEGKFVYNGFEQNTIAAGRQYINLDNQRFIGKNDFRQYPQSFDAVSVNIGMIDSLNFYYAFLGKVNTNNSNGRSINAQRRLSTHLINAKWEGYRYGTITGYMYFNRDRSIATNSHSILGIRASAIPNEDHEDINYSIEIAQQQAKFGNPNHYTAYYMHFSIDKTISWFKGTAGFERLGSDSGNAFITPMGSVDNFNGFAQVFTTTPNRGLQDAYATLSATNENVDITLAATYHYFRLDKGPGPKSAGQEIDISAVLKVNEQIDLTMAFAKYNPKSFKAPGTKRFWVAVTANLL